MERIHVRRMLRQVTDGRGWTTLANIVRPGPDGRPERVFIQEELFGPEEYRQVVAYHYSLARHHLFKARTYCEHAKTRYGLQLPLFDEDDGEMRAAPDDRAHVRQGVTSGVPASGRTMLGMMTSGSYRCRAVCLAGSAMRSRAGLLCEPAYPRYESTYTNVYSRSCRTGLIFPYDDTISRRTITVAPLTQETVPMAISPELTLLDVIQAVSDVAANEDETLAAIVHLLSSGQVRLSVQAMTAIRELLVTTTAAA